MVVMLGGLTIMPCLTDFGLFGSIFLVYYNFDVYLVMF